MTAEVQVVAHGRWGELVLDRPQRRNAVTAELVSGLRAGLRQLVEGGAAVVVLRGAGGTFCSGLDLEVFAGGTTAEFAAAWQALHVELFQCEAVLVGALERYAINGGAALALACDLLVAGGDAVLQVGEVAQGAPAPMNVAWLRARTTEAVAMEVALTGRRFSADELHRRGLVTEVVPAAEVRDRVVTLAATLAGFPEPGLRSVKAGVRAFTPATDAEEWFSRARRSSGASPGWTPRRNDADGGRRAG